MLLYDCSNAPNCRKLRIFLAEKNLTIESREVDIAAGENLSSPFIDINPHAILPTLQLPDNTIIDDSVAICRYLDEIHPHPPLFGKDPLERATIESWQRRCEFEGMARAMEVFRNRSSRFKLRGLTGTTDPVPAIPALVERGNAALKRFYLVMNTQLKKNTYIVGENFSIVDITAICIIDFACQLKIDIPVELQHLRLWRQRMHQRPSIADND